MKTLNTTTIFIFFFLAFSTYLVFEIAELKSENENLVLEVNNKSEYINSLEKKSIRSNNVIVDLNHTKNTLEDKLISKNNTIKTFEEKLNTSTFFYLPTKDKLKKLVLSSGIAYRNYDLTSYNCVDFSNDLIKHLKKNKIFSCRANICFGDKSHSFVSVNTTEGIIYIEPQTNLFFDKVNVGDDYCKITSWNCQRIINKFSDCH